MVTYRGILMMGDMLRSSEKKYWTLEELKEFLCEKSGSFSTKTLTEYLKILQRKRYIEFTSVNGIGTWMVLEKPL